MVKIHASTKESNGTFWVGKEGCVIHLWRPGRRPLKVLLPKGAYKIRKKTSKVVGQQPTLYGKTIRYDVYVGREVALTTPWRAPCRLVEATMRCMGTFSFDLLFTKGASNQVQTCRKRLETADSQVDEILYRHTELVRHQIGHFLPVKTFDAQGPQASDIS